MTWIVGVLLAFTGIFVGAAVGDLFQLRRRKGLSRADFCAAFQGDRIPEILVAVVYDHYASGALGDCIAISPDDRFESLRIGQDDIDEDLQSLLKKLGLELPSSATLAERSYPILTIGDVVHWLNWIRQHQTA